MVIYACIAYGGATVIKIHLSKLLGERRMTQKELAERAEIRPDTINAYYHEYIKRINKADLNKICNVLGCKIEELLEHIPD